MLSACGDSKPVFELEPNPEQNKPTYRMATLFKGDDRALSVVAIATTNAVRNTSVPTQIRLVDVANAAQQRWIFTKLVDGRFTISNQFISAGYEAETPSLIDDGAPQPGQPEPTAPAVETDTPDTLVVLCRYRRFYRKTKEIGQC